MRLFYCTQHCRNCGVEGHNKLKCPNPSKPMNPKKPPGRPCLRPVEASSSAQPVQETITQLGWGTGEGSSSQPNGGWKPWASTATALSEPIEEDLPSLSSVLPKRKRGRPRKNENLHLSSSQPLPAAPRETIYDRGLTVIPRVSWFLLSLSYIMLDMVPLNQS